MKAVTAIIVALGSFGVVSGFIGGAIPKQRCELPIQTIPTLTSVKTIRSQLPLVPPLFSKTELQASSVASGGHSGGIFQQWLSSLSSVASKLARNIRRDEVTQWRCAAILFVASIAIFNQRIDVGLEKLWKYLSTSSGLWARMFRHDRTWRG